MSLSGRLLPALANDDSHALESTRHDTYEGWTMVRVKERTVAAVLEALRSGCSYGSTGPQIRHIELRSAASTNGDSRTIEATVLCSEARRVTAIHDQFGVEYHEHGETFEEATFTLRTGTKWARFEVMDPDGRKAWSNPFDLSQV